MIEKTLINYLNGVMTGVPIGFEAPREKPSKYIVLERIDGGEIDHIKAATFLVDCYADSLLHAAELCELIEQHLLGAVRLDEISSASLGSKRANINTNTKSYCYECVINFNYY